MAAQDFYQARLRAGETALSAGRAAEAEDDLRIAAFGLLDQPALLCEALANLAVAQNKAGRPARATATLQRIAEVQRGFPACREAHLDSSRRAELEALARRSLPADVASRILASAEPSAPAPAMPPTPLPTAAPVLATAAPTAVPTRIPVPPAAAPTPAAAPAEDLDREPQLKTTTRPVYPESARRAGIGGIVLLRVLVSATGEPLRVEVARGVQPELDRAAVEAVRDWRFEPGRAAGRAVVAWMTVAVPFETPRP